MKKLHHQNNLDLKAVFFFKIPAIAFDAKLHMMPDALTKET
jgi:hypothetical protein